MRELLVALAVTAAAAAACNTSEPLPVTPNAVTARFTAIRVTGTGPLAGQTSQFNASGVRPDGSLVDITSQATWQSSNPGVATVSATGLVIGLSVGVTDIVATDDALLSGRAPALIPGTSGTYFMFVSDPGDPVGLGFSGFRGGPLSSVSKSQSEFRFPVRNVRFGAALGPDFNTWELTLFAPDGVVPGVIFMAPGAPTGVNRLSFTLNGRTCASPSGSFTFHQLAFSQEIFVTDQIRLTFEQHCNGRPESVRGEVSYNRF